MTDREDYHINSRFDKLDSAIEEIRRGLYGDKQNGVKGLIDNRDEDHRRILKLEDTKKKMLWTGGGIIIAVELLWHSLKHKFGL